MLRGFYEITAVPNPVTLDSQFARNPPARIIRGEDASGSQTPREESRLFIQARHCESCTVWAQEREIAWNYIIRRGLRGGAAPMSNLSALNVSLNTNPDSQQCESNRLLRRPGIFAGNDIIVGWRSVNTEIESFDQIIWFFMYP